RLLPRAADGVGPAEPTPDPSISLPGGSETLEGGDQAVLQVLEAAGGDVPGMHVLEHLGQAYLLVLGRDREFAVAALAGEGRVVVTELVQPTADLPAEPHVEVRHP